MTTPSEPMTVWPEPIEIRSGTITQVDPDEGLIDLIVIPYDQEAAVEYDGQMLLESVAPGAFKGIEARKEDVTVNRDHDYGRTFGKVLSYRADDPAGLVATVFVSKTDLGVETLRLAKDGVLKASAGMLVRRSDQIIRSGKRRIKRAYLDHVALVPNPAYRGAAVLSVRQEQQPLSVDKGRQLLTPNLDEIMTLLGMRD